MVIGREIALPVWLVDVLEGVAIFIIDISPVILVVVELNLFTTVIVLVIDFYFAIVVSLVYFLQGFFFAFRINADDSVQHLRY